MKNSFYLSNPDLARVAQQMTTLPMTGEGLASSIRGAEAALLGFDVLRMVEAQPLDDKAPLLSAPRPGRKSDAATDPDTRISPQATLLKILASLGQVVDLSASNLQQAAAQLASVNQAKAERLVALGNDYQAAVAISEQATAQVESSAQAVQAAHEVLVQAQARVEQNPLDAVAQQQLVQARQAFSLAQNQYAANVNAAQGALARADGLHDQIQLDLDRMNSAQINQAAQRHLDAGAQLAMVMALLSNAIYDSLTLSLQAKNEQAQQAQDIRIEKERAEAEERAKQAKKQEAMSKKVNCAMKILGALITAVSAVSAVFTGGASLALAAVGLAMMAADAVAKEITGTSLTERIMQPLMEHVLKPLIDALSKMVTGLLESCGVDKDKAEQAGHIIGSVLGTVLMAVAAVAAMVVGKGAAEKLLKPLLKMAQKMIGKMLPQVMKNLGSQGAAVVSKSFARMSRGIGNKVPASLRRGVSKLGGRERIGNHLEQVGNLMTVGKAASDGGTRIAIADMAKKVGDMQVLIDLLMGQDLIEKMRNSDVAKHTKAAMAILANLDSEMSNVLGADTSRNRFILNNLSGHAA